MEKEILNKMTELAELIRGHEIDKEDARFEITSFIEGLTHQDGLKTSDTKYFEAIEIVRKYQFII